MMADPLLQPFTIKHLTLRNRVLITAHEPAYAEDGMPKARYHAERARAGVALTMTAAWRLTAARREGNQLVATLASDYTAETRERRVDQIVVNEGVRPLEELYFELKPLSRNLGAVDYAALIAGRAQERVAYPGGAFQLFRIGDAVSARNVHAAIYDALRLARAL